MQKGSVVEFKHKSSLKAGVLESPEGKSSWTIQDERGQSYILPSRDILFVLPNFTASTATLGGFLERTRVLEASAELELAWEILSGQKTVSLEDLCNWIYSQVTPEGLWATRQVLSRDKIYFKEKNDAYEIRDAAHVEELKRAASAQETKAHSAKELLERWNRRRTDKSLPWKDEDHPRIEALKALVIHGEEATGKNLALKTLELFDRPGTPEGAFKLLVDQGIWTLHENLGIHKRGITVEFTPEELAQVQALNFSTSPDEDETRRQDFTHFRVFTIDSESTVEIDDGLSLEITPSGEKQIWVHIADPSRLVSLGSPVETLARKRGTSIYLPTGMIPMLPLDLTAGPLSLNQDQITPALSFGIILDPEGKISEFQIVPSLIKPKRRLTYAQADELLESRSSEPELSELADLGALRRSFREKKGASVFRLPEIDPVVKNGEILLEPVPDTPSRQLVSEMMILAGEVAGLFGAQHNLPLPYRGQNTPEGDMDALLLIPEGPARDYARRRMMPRSTTMSAPVPHYSLGLEAYVQVTSPLRRYNDLLAHYQIKSILRPQTPPLTKESLEALLPQSQEASSMAAGLERETNKYWYLEYLRRHQSDVYKAVVLGVMGQDDRAYQIIFWDLGLEWIFKHPKPLQLGQEIQIKIKAVDPRLERLVLTEA